MKQKTIYFKTENNLINSIKKSEDIKILKKPTGLFKLFSKKNYADIYFHTGNLDEDSIEEIKNSKITIANSFSFMNLILKKTNIDHKKVKVIYPSVNMVYKEPKLLKKDFLERFSLPINTKLIFFTANNFKNSGIKEFLDIVSNLSFMDFSVIIAGSKQQLAALDFTLTKYQ